MANCTDSTTRTIAQVSADVGAIVSIISTLLLGFLWYKAIQAKNKLRALTWAVPPGSNVGKKTFFANKLRSKGGVDRNDDQIIRVKGGFGPDIVTLHTERLPDVGRPVTILSCHDTAWAAIKASRNIEGDLLVTLLVLSLGNLVASGVAFLCVILNRSSDLVTNLAGNTLLVIAPLTLMSLKLLYSKGRERYASRKESIGGDLEVIEVIDIETILLAIKESVEGNVRLLVPVFSMSYILKKHDGPETSPEQGPELVFPGGAEASPEDGQDSVDSQRRQTFFERLEDSELVQWFEINEGAEELYKGFSGLYDRGVFRETSPFRAAWLGKLLLGCKGESDRNRIISSTVLSHLRWSILHATDADKETTAPSFWRKLLCRTNAQEIGNDEESSKGGLDAALVHLNMEEALLLDSEGKSTITFAKQGSNTKYYVPFVMLDTVSISKAGGTLNKHWAAYEGRKHMQNNEELKAYLYEEMNSSPTNSELRKESLDLWALVNKLPDKRTSVIEKAINHKWI